MLNINDLLYYTIAKSNVFVIPARVYVKDEVNKAVTKEGHDCRLTLKSRIRLAREVHLRHFK